MASTDDIPNDSSITAAVPGQKTNSLAGVVSNDSAAQEAPYRNHPSKLDPVTVLQDTIDGFSLSLFEALRKLRDAVAPPEGSQCTTVAADDAALVASLAEEVLKKSDAVDEMVAKMPGMHRNKEEQLQRIEWLIRENHTSMKQLETEYEEAKRIRGKVRECLQEVTCKVLDIEEEL